MKFDMLHFNLIQRAVEDLNEALYPKLPTSG